MNVFIEIFNMQNISDEVKCRLLIKMGRLINHQYAANITEYIVYELVMLLDPDHEIKDDPHFKFIIDGK